MTGLTPSAARRVMRYSSLEDLAADASVPQHVIDEVLELASQLVQESVRERTAVAITNAALAQRATREEHHA